MHFESVSVSYLSVLLVCWMIPVVLELKFGSPIRRVMRLLLWTIAIACLSSTLLQPSVWHTPEKRNAVIGNIAVEVPKNTLHIHPNEATAHLQNNVYRELLLSSPLEAWQLQLIQADTVIFYPQKSYGLIDVQIPPAYTGEELAVTVLPEGDDTVTLVLRLMEADLDSVQWWPGKGPVELRTVPKSAGPFLYTILAKKETSTIYQENLAIQIQKSRKPSVLLLSSNPGFEARFIKNYLTENGYEVSSRTRISKDRYREEFINSPKKSLAPITLPLLEAFELLIMDPEMMDLLTSQEKRLITQKTENGLLAVLFLSHTEADIRSAAGKRVQSISTITQKITGYHAAESFQVTGTSMVPVSASDLLIGYRWRSGIGWLATTTFPDLYVLALSGNARLYGQMIDALVQPTLPSVNDTSAVSWPEIARINERTVVHFTSNAENPSLRAGEVNLPIRESAFRPGDYQAIFWPDQQGWIRVSQEPEGISSLYYVYRSDDWQVLKHHQLNRLNEQFAKTYKRDGKSPLPQKMPISGWWFMAGALLSLCGLWVEQRFFS